MGHTAAALRAVASNVKAARLRAGLSVEQLSARAQVSKGALVSLENAQGNPNLATLVRLADALGMSVSALTEGPRQRDIQIVEAADAEPLWTGEHGGEARLMLTTSGPAPVEVWRWRLHPGEAYPSHPHPAGVVETVSVIRGCLALVLDGVEHQVPTGATATFDGGVPHTYRGGGAEPCELLMTVHLPPHTTGGDH
ncbi:helix-turn-helix transcriptional regulator [Microbispora sp. NEAU-D428]|uniref:cupin domain-containing protein n=1 Tax=Microbispora sitophila TaxID=2771537 RepID=UPI001865CDCF|nr:XRE family transcriptional regulator [Microbispora sitophila]MBE3011307.1 helix-turn-helix transcriptional regulator [Microbispora sitophila]